MHDQSLIILKFVSIGLAGFFGVLALVVKYKDDKERLTNWGRVALVGVVVSTLVSAGAQGVESARAEAKAREAEKESAANLKQSKEILLQIERLMQPLDPPELTVYWDVPKEHPLVARYIDRLAAAGRRMVAAGLEVGSVDPATGAHVNSGMKGKPASFVIPPGSGLYPNRSRNGELYVLLLETGASASAFPTPASAKIARSVFSAKDAKCPLGYFGNQGDLGFDTPTEEDNELSYSIERGVLSVRTQGVPDPKYIRKRAGTILSVPDLERSTLMLCPDYTMVADLSAPNDHLTAARRLFTPSFVVLRANGREYMFRAGDIRAHRPSDGAPVFYVEPVSSGFEP